MIGSTRLAEIQFLRSKIQMMHADLKEFVEFIDKAKKSVADFFSYINNKMG
jgi:hypothetical protein